MRSLYLTIGDRTRASTRYRVFYPKPHLESRGIDCTIKKNYLTKRRGVRRVGDAIAFVRNVACARSHDIVTIQKALPSERKLKAFLSLESNLVYDFDDAIFTTPPWRDGTRDDRQRRLDRTLDLVTYVVAGSPALADYASEYCDYVYEVPTAIPREPYMEYRDDSYSGDENVVLGWIGYPHSLWYLHQIEDPLSQILDEHDEAELLVVTGDDLSEPPLKERIGEDVRYVKWSEERELDYINEFDIGIRPLSYDTFTRAKGGFTTVIQCMGMAKPVVVTPVGLLDRIVEHGVNGFHADSPREWIEHIEFLISNPDRRHQMGENAFKRVGQEGFWMDQMAEKLADIYESVVKGVST